VTQKNAALKAVGEHSMKMKNLNIIAALSLLLVLTAATTLAQGTTLSTKVEVPFAFSVGSEQLPAGKYVISKNGNTLLITSTRGKGSVATFAAGRITNDRQSRIGRLVFNRYNNQYFLSEIWLPGEGLGRELKVKVSETELAKSVARDRIEIAVAGR
jgi:hypothetical protein